MKIKFILFLIIITHIFPQSEEFNIYLSPLDLHSSKNIILLIDPVSGYIFDYSIGAESFYSYDNLIGMNISQINTLSPAEIKIEMKNALNEKRNYFHFKHKIRSGEIKEVYVTSYPVERNGKKILLSIVRDVTLELKRESHIQLIKYLLIAVLLLACFITLYLLRKIRLSEKNYEDLFENMTEAFASYELVDNQLDKKLNYRCIQVNPYFEDLTSTKSADILGKLVSNILPNIEDSVMDILDSVAKTGNAISFKHYVKDRDRYYDYHAFSPSKNRFALVFSDITEQENLKNQLKLQIEKAEIMATHDYLTGLPNRVLFLDRAENAISNAKRLNHSFALCMIDLDDFKQINDSFGHLMGDYVLKTISERTKLTLRDSDTLSRFGGDEFLCIITNFDEKEFCKTVVERILKANQTPIFYNGISVKPTFSIGISIYPQDGNSIEELLKNADLSLYKAKGTGKNRFCFFNNYCTYI